MKTGRNRKIRVTRRGKTPFIYLVISYLVISAVLALVGLFAFSPLIRIHKNQAASVGRRNPSTSTSELSAWESSAATQINPLKGRQVFPYSVISGGLESKQELKNAIASDPVVAAHYAGFDLAKARVVRLDHDRAVYVSYRLGNTVFWTKKRLKIRAGETLITDGENMARTRCGNRLSESPKGPVSPKEPPAPAFEAPQGNPPLVAYDPPFDLPLTPPAVGKSVDHGPAFAPPFIWFPPIGVGPAPVTPGTPSQPPPISTPEPDTLLLLSTGLSAIWLARKRRRV